MEPRKCPLASFVFSLLMFSSNCKPAAAGDGYSMRLTERAMASINRGDLAEAIRLCDQAIKVDSGFAGAYSCRGVARFRSGDYRDAKADLSQAIKLKAPVPGLHRLLADSEAELNERGAALDQYNAAVKEEPKDGKVYYERAVLYLKMGKLKEASDDCKVSIRLAPNDPMAVVATAAMIFKCGDRAGAVCALEIAKKLFRNQGDLVSANKVQLKIDAVKASLSKPQASEI